MTTTVRMLLDTGYTLTTNYTDKIYKKDNLYIYKKNKTSSNERPFIYCPTESYKLFQEGAKPRKEPIPRKQTVINWDSIDITPKKARTNQTQYRHPVPFDLAFYN